MLSSLSAQAGLGYAPPLLPDELLYSWLGRFAYLNALGSPRDCVERIFGSRTTIPGIDLPAQLHAVQQQLGDWLPFQTIDHLLDFGTLLPYHRPFLTEARYDAVRHTLLHGDGKGLKTQIGRVANRFGANPALRFCGLCVADSITRHGSPYWLRRHQLPGVNCCTSHGIQLQQQPPLCLRTDRQRFVISTGWFPAGSHVEASAQQLRFAELSEAVLSATLPVIDEQHRAAAYRNAVLAMGFGTRLGRVDYGELAMAVRQHFEDFRCFVHRERLLASTASPLGWIRELIDRPARSLHPICHLLLIEFLFGSIPEFTEACSIHQVRMASFEQQDAAASRSRSVTPAGLEYEAALSDISLSCRQVASLLGRSVTTAVMQRRVRGIAIRERRKNLSVTSIEAIRTELSSGDPLPAVAARSGVSLSTVYRVLAQYPSSRPPYGREDSSTEATKRRGRWLTVLSVHGHAGVNAIRAAAPADYAWLYKHDHPWLMSSTRSILRQPVGGPRLNWAQRDAQLCQQTVAYAAALRDQSPPTRVTRTRLLRPLGEAMVRKNMNQLPLLEAALDEISESQEAFGIRRIDHAISALARSGSNLQIWRIKRLAGLRLWSDALSSYMNLEVERLNAQNPVRADRIP